MAELTRARRRELPALELAQGPVRKLRYEVINNCPIFNYTERELRFLFGSAASAAS